MPTNSDSPTIPEGYRRLEGSERRTRKGARHVGPADPQEQVLVSIYVRRKPGAPPLLEQGHWAATPPGKRTFLSREEFASLHGASPNDLKTVADFAASQGLKVVSTSVARRLVQVSGTVEQMNKAFAVQLGRYESDKESYRGREGPIHLPNHVADVVEGVFGLDNRRMARKSGNGGPPGANGLTPPQVANLYNFPTTGASHQAIGLLEFNAPDRSGAVGGGYNVTTDLDPFFSGLGLSTPKITAVTVDGASNTQTGDPGGPDGEITLDIDVAGSVAPTASIVVYFAPIGSEQDWADIVTTAINDTANKPSVLSCSWGWPELEADVPASDTASPWPFEWTQMAITKMSQSFQEAAMMGVTVFSGSGDYGSDYNEGDGQAHVPYPGTDPWVTCCGGTIITNVSGSSFTEDTWNDQAYPAGGATGGGISEVIPLPAWQQGTVTQLSVNPGHKAGRGVPDVAGNASSYSGYTLTIDGGTYPNIGGTSAVGPLYAGLIAIINEALGQPVGYLNPTLYALAADPDAAGVFREIDDGVSNSYNGAPGYTSGPGWNACTGLGVINGAALLAELQGIYTKAVRITLDRDHFGQDEVDGVRAQTGSAVFQAAFFVIVDGFTPKQLGITGPTSLSAAPVVTFTPATGVTNTCSSLESDDPSFGPEVQRFRFGYDVNFGSSDAAFGFSGESETVTLNTSYQGMSASAQVQFIKQPDPYILQGPQTWWLSNDIRLIQVAEGGTAFGVPMGNDPYNFLQNLTSALDAGQGNAGGQSFDKNTQEDSEVLTVAPQNSAHQNVYNFAIARVHYQGYSSQAQAVRVFFRLFAANSTATDFQPDSTYRRYAAYSPAYPVPAADYFQNVLPELGVGAGEYLSVPCFAEARVNPAQSGSANSLPSLQTPDSNNVQTLPPTGNGPPRDYFYGCFLDINQVGSQSTSLLPAMPPSGNTDGPWPGITLEPIQQAFIVNEHQCLVAEIAFDPVPIDTGTPPWNSDKLAQRNISWSYVANPGVTASRQAMEPFEVRPTPSSVASGELPDELMIDWTNVPVGQAAQIYLPAVDAVAIVAKSVELYRTERLTVVDANTIGCTTGGVTYIPLPQGSGGGANFVGLMTINLPFGIKKGQSFTVIVRQLTNASATVPPPPPPPPPTQLETGTPQDINSEAPQPIIWRRVLGTFQINIPVSTKEILLPKEEQRLAIFRWIGEAMPTTRRWYPVFQRYLEGIANRVKALGGNPETILPSSSGNIPSTCAAGAHHPKREHDLVLTGKIAGLIFDHFGDFEGFLLDTGEHEHHFFSREKEVAELAQRAWRERLRLTARAERCRPDKILSVTLWPPPVPFGG